MPTLAVKDSFLVDFEVYFNLALLFKQVFQLRNFVEDGFDYFNKISLILNINRDRANASNLLFFPFKKKTRQKMGLNIKGMDVSFSIVSPREFS